MNHRDLDRILRSWFARPKKSGDSGGDEIDYNLLARYAEGTAGPDDRERVQNLRDNDPLFAELVEEPADHSSKPIRVIPMRPRWMPVMLRYAAGLAAILIGSVYLYTRLSDRIPARKLFITADSEQVTPATPARSVALDDASTPVFSRAAGDKDIRHDTLADRTEQPADHPVATMLRERSSSLLSARVTDTEVKETSALDVDQDAPGDAIESEKLSLARKAETAVIEEAPGLAVTVAGELAESSDELPIGTDRQLVKTASEPVLAAAVATSQPVGIQSNLYALFVGIDEYNPKDTGIFPLSDAVSSMEDAQRSIQSLGVTAELITLTNREATRETINAAIMNLRRAAGPAGTVVLYFAGKGWRNPELPDREYFVPWDGSIATEKLAAENIPLATLARYEEVLPVHSTCIILDCSFPPVPQSEVALEAGGQITHESLERRSSGTTYDTKGSAAGGAGSEGEDLRQAKGIGVMRKESAVRDEPTEKREKRRENLNGPADTYDYQKQKQPGTSNLYFSEVIPARPNLRLITFGADSPLLQTIQSVILSNTTATAESR